MRYYSKKLRRVLTEAEARAAGLRQPTPLHPRGLGCVVERLAKPMARWIDARHTGDPALGWVVLAAVRAGWVKLPLAGCSACSGRKARLNQLVTDVWAWRAWATALQGLFSRLAKPRKAR